MYAVSAHNTAKGYRQIVQDNGIDLRRKPNISEEMRADPIGYANGRWRRLKAAEAREMRRAASEEAAERAARYKAGVPYRITLAEIERRICKATRVSRAEIHSSRRSMRVVLARQAFMYWARRLTSRSLPEIGRFVGGRDHTTVLHASRVYPDKRAERGRTLRRFA
ncbi:MAG: hypothetical protein JJ864_08580 [Rhizobiaceae bacterium]|nr:hypothetical protein [Rhizobiaceae bacterium]